MMESKKIAMSFYEAFKRRDAEAMGNLYSDDVLFKDPAFGELIGDDARMMWKMLCSSATDLEISYTIISSEKDSVTVAWEAIYTFSKTGRKVHNKIKASLKIKEAKIISHVDAFDLHSWANQAFGIKGILIGWTGFFRKKLQQQTNTMLQKFIKTQ